MIIISLSLIEPGYVRADLVNQSNETVSVLGSHFTNVIDDLISAFIVIGREVKEKIIEWQDPPGQYRWRLTRMDNYEVYLRVVSFEDSYSNKDDNKGKTIFEGKDDLIRLTRSVIRAVDQLLIQFQPTEFNRITKHLFPNERLNQLKNVLKDIKNKA